MTSHRGRIAYYVALLFFALFALMGARGVGLYLFSLGWTGSVQAKVIGVECRSRQSSQSLKRSSPQLFVTYEYTVNGMAYRRTGFHQDGDGYGTFTSRLFGYNPVAERAKEFQQRQAANRPIDILYFTAAPSWSCIERRFPLGVAACGVVGAYAFLCLAFPRLLPARFIPKRWREFAQPSPPQPNSSPKRKERVK